MAGFLDRDTRIIDMVLTCKGKSLFSKGDLHFCYWIPFDDDIDYQPTVSESGSLSAIQLTASIKQSIEDTPIREAVSGYTNFNNSGSDFTNVRNPMFTMAQGQKVLPRAVFPDDTEKTILTNQRMVRRIYQDRDNNGKYNNSISPRDIGVERFDSTAFSLEFAYEKDSFPHDFRTKGFHIKVLRSGSDGLTEVVPKRDMSNDLSYSNDVRVFTDKDEG